MIRPLICTALGLVLFISAAGATPPPPPDGAAPPPRPHALIEAHAEDLGIDEATVQEILEIAEDGREEMEQLQSTVEQTRQSLGQLLSAEEPDRAAVMSTIDELGQAETELLKHQIETLMEIRARLTPEQRQALERLGEQESEAGGHPHPPPPHP